MLRMFLRVFTVFGLCSFVDSVFEVRLDSDSILLTDGSELIANLPGF